MTKVAKARGRRPSDVALTREQIVTAALDILTVKGIEAFSVRDLAKVLGVYPAAIYHHISTKNELLSEVVAFALRELEPPSEGGSWQEWLRQLFIRYRAAVQQTPAVATLIGARIVSNGGVGPDLDVGGLRGQFTQPDLDALDFGQRLRGVDVDANALVVQSVEVAANLGDSRDGRVTVECDPVRAEVA